MGLGGIQVGASSTGGSKGTGVGFGERGTGGVGGVVGLGVLGGGGRDGGEGLSELDKRDVVSVEVDTMDRAAVEGVVGNEDAGYSIAKDLAT